MAWGASSRHRDLLGGARNPLAMGILFEATEVKIGFLQWLIADIPVVVVMLGVAAAVLYFMYPASDRLPQATKVLERQLDELGEFPAAKRASRWSRRSHPVVDFRARVDSLAVTAMAAVAVLFIFKLTTWTEVERNVNWGVFLMYGGAIALGQALHQTARPTGRSTRCSPAKRPTRWRSSRSSFSSRCC
jgi:sodium-dependent dicarboxylate transporter 2/3/5